MLHALEAVGNWLAANTPGNLAASALWSPIAFAAGYVIGKRKLAPIWHKHTASVESLHSKLDEHHEQLGLLLEVHQSKPKPPPSKYTGGAVE
jgi:hypothetical protein